MLRDLVIQKKTFGLQKKTVVTDFLFLSGMTLAGSWSVVGGAPIQAFTFFTASAYSIMITVGCQQPHCKAFAQTLVGLLGPHCNKKRGRGHVQC